MSALSPWNSAYGGSLKTMTTTSAALIDAARGFTLPTALALVGDIRLFDRVDGPLPVRGLHQHVDARVDRLHDAARGVGRVPVRAHESLEADLLLEHVRNQVIVRGEALPVPGGVAHHDASEP